MDFKKWCQEHKMYIWESESPEVPQEVIQRTVDMLRLAYLKSDEIAQDLSDRLDAETPEDPYKVRLYLSLSGEARGKIYGLRLALCAMFGLPECEADHEGLVDTWIAGMMMLEEWKNARREKE